MKKYEEIDTYTIPIKIDDLNIDEIKNYLLSKNFKIIFINYESGIDSHLKIKFENKLDENEELQLMSVISRLNHTS
jgi:hypothetical protein